MRLRTAWVGASIGAFVLFTTGPLHADPTPAPVTSRVQDARSVVRGLERDMSRLLERVTCSTVCVMGCEHVQGDDLLTGAGSGVIVHHHGIHVVTNAHVVKGCKAVRVITCDGRRYSVRVRSIDEPHDLALLKFESTPPASRAVPLHPGANRLPTEGTWVLAVGNPFLLGLDGQPVSSLGVVSGVRHPRYGGYRIKSVSIQHDAEINPGNSGGPLWSLAGTLVGINGAIVTRGGSEELERRGYKGGPSHTGVSFSVPVREVVRFIERVTPGARSSRRPAASATRAEPTISATMVRSWLGASYRTTYDERGEKMGALLVAIFAGSPLQDAQTHDVITAVQVSGRNFAVRSADDLEQALRHHRPGAAATFTLLRGGRTFATTHVLGS